MKNNKSKHIGVLILAIVLLVSGCDLMSQPDTGKPPNINMNEPEIHQQGYKLFNIAPAHEQGINGSGVKVAVLDTGVDLKNNDLTISGFKNFVDNNSNVQDKNGHGTKISGIISARKNNHGLLGIAPKVKLYIGKVANDMGYVKTKNLVKGIDWAIKEKVDIINISLEINKGSQELHNAVKRAERVHILVIASSGNRKDNHSKRTVPFPARYKEVIAVGMLNPNGQLSKFGFRDPKIEIYAPGEDIVSTYLNNKLTLDTGASFATAYASGEAALLTQINQEANISNADKRVIKQLHGTFDQNMYPLNNALLDAFKVLLILGVLLLETLLVILVVYLLNKKIQFKKILFIIPFIYVGIHLLAFLVFKLLGG